LTVSRDAEPCHVRTIKGPPEAGGSIDQAKVVGQLPCR